MSLRSLLTHILGQKRNAAYKTYIIYGRFFTILSQTIRHSLSADSRIMSSWGCPSYHCHRAKLIQQFKPTFWSILTSRHLTMTSWMRTVWHCSKLSETFPETFDCLCMAWYCWAITDGDTLACNILFTFSRSACVHFGSVKYQCVVFDFNFFNCFHANWI